MVGGKELEMIWYRAAAITGRWLLSMLPTVPSPSPKCHQMGHQPCKMSPILVTMEGDNRRDSLEITDLRRFLRLHGMQEVRGSSPLPSTMSSKIPAGYVTSLSSALVRVA